MVTQTHGSAEILPLLVTALREFEWLARSVDVASSLSSSNVSRIFRSSRDVLSEPVESYSTDSWMHFSSCHVTFHGNLPTLVHSFSIGILPLSSAFPVASVYPLSTEPLVQIDNEKQLSFRIARAKPAAHLSQRLQPSKLPVYTDSATSCRTTANARFLDLTVLTSFDGGLGAAQSSLWRAVPAEFRTFAA